MMNTIAKIIKVSLLVALISLFSFPSKAAEFHISDDKETLVLNGFIMIGDYSKFAKEIKKYPNVKMVILNSGGGYAIDGFKIGIHIKRNRLNTFVPSNASCASACSYIWLAGYNKFWGEGGNILFHVIFSADGNPLNDPKVMPIDKIVTSYYMGDIQAPISLTVEIVENTNPTTFLKLTKESVIFFNIPRVVWLEAVPQPRPRPDPNEVN